MAYGPTPLFDSSVNAWTCIHRRDPSTGKQMLVHARGGHHERRLGDERESGKSTNEKITNRMRVHEAPKRTAHPREEEEEEADEIRGWSGDSANRRRE